MKICHSLVNINNVNKEKINGKEAMERNMSGERRFWKAHIHAWKKSGLTQRDYCLRNSLKDTQFTYWKTKFNKEKVGQVSFVPVPVPAIDIKADNGSDDSGLSVQLGNIQIRVANNFNSSSLVKVVSALENRL